MKTKTRLLSAVLMLILTIALAIVPMITITATAEEAAATLTFDANKENRTSYSTAEQIWEQNGIKFTNAKGSGNNVGDYANPVRCYKNSSITVEYPNMKKIEFNCNDTTYATDLGKSINGSTVDGKVVTVNFNSAQSSFTATLGAQIRINSITVYAEVNTGCNHADTTTTTTVATCTAAGKTTVTCNSCGVVVSTEEVVAALGHSYTSVTTPAACNAKGLITYACGREGCGHSYTEETAFLAHSFADGACSVCGMKEIDESALYTIMVRRNESVTYRFITSTLTDGSPKRFAVIDSGLTELIADGSYVASEIAFKFVENDDGSYYIYSPYIDDDAKYVGWTSGNSAAFVNEAAARRVNVLPNGEGGYTFIMADTGRYFALNSTASNDYAAWYESEQANNLQLISVNVCTEHSGGEADCENLAKCETCGTAYGELDAEEHIEKLTGASVNIGADLSIKYYVDLCEHKDVTSYSMKFVMNGKETVVTAYTEVDGEYVFTFSGIAPQCMSDNIEAYLYAGDELIDSVTEYSIKKYAEKLLASGLTDKAKRLVTDMLYYGAAAQEYKGYNTENLATDGVANIGGVSTATVTETGKSVEGQSEVLNFTAAGVRFDYVNKIYAKFYADDINSVTVTVNDVDVTDMVEALGDNVYVIYTEAISAVNFNTSSVIVITDGENTATLTYSVNDYAYNMANSATASEGMKKLAKALYRYGRAAANYNK